MEGKIQLKLFYFYLLVSQKIDLLNVKLIANVLQQVILFFSFLK